MDGQLLVEGSGPGLERALRQSLSEAWHSNRRPVRPRVQIWRFRRPTFLLLWLSEDSHSSDWWLEFNPEIGGTLARAIGRRVFVLLGDDHEQRVFGFDSSGLCSLELEGPAPGPFTTLARQLSFRMARWMWPVNPPDVDERLSRPKPPPRPARGVAVAEVLDVPRRAARSPRALAWAWTRHGQTIASRSRRTEVLQLAPGLPLLDELVTVSVELSESEWSLLERASAMLGMGPGVLLAAALFVKPRSRSR